MNNKGQALVEFVLILPVFILILFTIIDFGEIISNKNSLENDSIDIVNLIKNDKTIEDINTLYPDIDINITKDNNYTKLKITKQIDIITPGLNRILEDPYSIYVERIIYDE